MFSRLEQFTHLICVQYNSAKGLLRPVHPIPYRPKFTLTGPFLQRLFMLATQPGALVSVSPVTTRDHFHHTALAIQQFPLWGKRFRNRAGRCTRKNRRDLEIAATKRELLLAIPNYPLLHRSIMPPDNGGNFLHPASLPQQPQRLQTHAILMISFLLVEFVKRLFIYLLASQFAVVARASLPPRFSFSSYYNSRPFIWQLVLDLVITHMFKCDCIDPVFFHRRGRKARREGLFDYLCDLCALSGEMWVITRY